VLGTAQTDFARNWAKEGRGLADLLAEAVPAALADAGVEPGDVEVVHLGNLAGELFAGQAQLGGLLLGAVDGLDGVPSTRHEAACASGSTAVLAACADMQAGHYDLALVVGVELMRNVDAQTAAAHLGTAAWAGHEATEARFPWPALFAEIAEAYDARYGLDHEPLGVFAETAFGNARANPLAQTRGWSFPDGAFGTDDGINPPVEGRLRKTDCGRITDGAAAVLLASPRWLERHHRNSDDLAAITGFGHRTAPLALADKLRAAPPEGYLFPHLHAGVADAYRRADIGGPEALDVVELHDCFSITGLVAIEHLGLAEPGKGVEAILDGRLQTSGRLPVNPGGGLLGLGHPVGATGVRMLRDVARQVTDTAGDIQIPGARTGMTVNVGGSFTTVVTTVVQRGAS
jgi:acetyl-CoA C-acetyltransferase